MRAHNQTITRQRVAPSLAEEWLNRNDANRHLRRGVVEQYAADMEAGAWGHCTTPIAFYSDGNLADGQHRLWAVVESGKPQEFYVVRGLSRSDGLNIDTGAPRTVVDAGKISGLDPHLSTGLISACRSIEEGRGGHTRTSHAHKMAWVNAHREAGEWVTAHGPKGRKLMGGAVMGAVGRAWYHVEDHDKLMRFCDVVSKGFSEGQHESAAVSLRNYLLSSAADLNSSALWRDTFLKTQNAIYYFMASRPLTVIRTITEERYPLAPTDDMS